MLPYLSYFLKLKYDFLPSLLKIDRRVLLSLGHRGKRPKDRRSIVFILALAIMYLGQGCTHPVNSPPSASAQSASQPTSQPYDFPWCSSF